MSEHNNVPEAKSAPSEDEEEKRVCPSCNGRKVKTGTTCFRCLGSGFELPKEKLGREFWAIMRSEGLAAGPWEEVGPSMRERHYKVASRFRDKCVAKHKELEDAARAFFAVSDRDAAMRRLSAALLAIDLSTPHGRLVDDAKTVLPDQGEAREDKLRVSDEEEYPKSENGRCPCFNDHDGSCMYMTALDEETPERCLSGKLGWADKHCPAMNSDKLERKSP